MQSQKDIDSLLIHLLSDGYPVTFVEMYHLINNKPATTPEHPETPEFVKRVKAQLCKAESGKRQGNSDQTTRAYLEIARLYRSVEQTRLAIFFLERSLDLARATDSASAECAVLQELVKAREALGETEAAVEAAEAHRTAAARLGSSAEEGHAAEELARTYRSQAAEAESKAEDKDAALNMRLRELAAAREVGDPRGEADAAYAVGRCYMMAGQPLYGVNYFKQYLSLAKTLQEEHGDSEHVARAYAGLAAAHVASHAFEPALECLQDLLSIAQSAGNVSAHAHALESMGTLFARQGKYAQAEASLEAGYRLRKGLMDSGAAGASRPELDKTRILLGVIKAAAAHPRASSLLSTVVANDVKALLEWRVARKDLLPQDVQQQIEQQAEAVAPGTAGASAHPADLSRLMSTSYRPVVDSPGGQAGTPGPESPGPGPEAVAQ